MADHNDLGILGEKLAQEFLVKKGYEILETNWTYLKAEIDIIARIEPGILVIAEVKTRTNTFIGKPEEFVSRGKQQQLVKAADAYIKEKGWQDEVRFDIIAVVLNEKYQQIEHLADAFYFF